MRWLACFSPGPTLESESRKPTCLPAQVSKPITGGQPLEKQDSAYGLEREALKSLPRDNDIAVLDEDAVLQKEMEVYNQMVTAESSIAESQSGRAASVRECGAPKPSCNEARLDNLKELGLLDKASGDPQIQHIMQLMCIVFNTNCALVALLGDDRVYIHDAINFQRGEYGWRMSMCAHTLSPTNHQVMIVENPQKDARFAHLPIVQHGKISFYASTPIVSSRGHRLGTVCFLSDKPRKFDAEGSQMLINMGELITRELEREWMAAQEAKRQSSQDQEIPGLVRAVECFNDAVMFVDTSQPKWQILHLNSAAQTKLKLYDVNINTADESKPVLLWDVFQILHGRPEQNESAPWETHTSKLEAGQNFMQPGVRFNVRYSSNGQSLPTFNLNFRCAATTNIDSNAAAVGVPASLPTSSSNHKFYFVTMALDHSSRNSNQSLLSALTGRSIGKVPFDGVELGPMLGKGGYGSVFRGIKHDAAANPSRQIVAIKVIDNASNLRMVDGAPLETSITRNAHHRNVVNTLDYAIQGAEDGDAQQSSLHDSAHSRWRTESQVWMLLEYCDCGSLQEASEKGFFREDGEVQLALILAVAHDVASGMAFLHAQGVGHGDLTGGNVLLASDDHSALGVVAKVADFGLARNLDVASKIETRTYGTVTHMPAELVQHGIFTKATDVYAFGVLLWEMWHGVRAWSSLTFAQIITAVVANKKSLSFDASADSQYADLSLRCMSSDPDKRPTFDEVLISLEQLQRVHLVK